MNGKTEIVNYFLCRCPVFEIIVHFIEYFLSMISSPPWKYYCLQNCPRTLFFFQGKSKDFTCVFYFQFYFLIFKVIERSGSVKTREVFDVMFRTLVQIGSNSAPTDYSDVGFIDIVLTTWHGENVCYKSQSMKGSQHFLSRQAPGIHNFGTERGILVQMPKYDK